MSKKLKDIDPGAAKLAGLIADMFHKMRNDSITMEELERFVGKNRMLGDCSHQLARWKSIFRGKGFDGLGLELDFSKILIPEKHPGFPCLVIVPPIKTEQAFQACSKHFPTVKRIDAILDVLLDPSKEVRDPYKNGPYAIWVEDRRESGDGSAGVKEDPKRTMTWRERILFELFYFVTYGEHLDKQDPTKCTGSSMLGVGAPYAMHNVDGFQVGITEETMPAYRTVRKSRMVIA